MSLPKINQTIRSNKTGFCYEIKAIISEGGFGTVFKGVELTRHEKREVALKMERWEKSMQSIEVAVLKTAQNCNCFHFPDLIDYGNIRESGLNFMVLTLLGKDLYRLRKEQRYHKFSLSTAVRIGYQTMEAIEELHMKCRFICRDIKPSNFVIGLPNTVKSNKIFIIDFGLCRRYTDKNNNIIPSRGEVGWRGTSRYASLQCHMKMDLSRRDDLESWFYMLIEATVGRVLWQNEKDRDAILKAKLNARNKNNYELLKDCPSQYAAIFKHITAMEFPETPDYNFFYSTLRQICHEQNFNNNDIYDWESNEILKLRTTNENEISLKLDKIMIPEEVTK